MDSDNPSGADNQQETSLSSVPLDLTDVGFEWIVRLAYRMNANGKQRSRTLEEVLEGSSETVREAHARLSTGVGRYSPTPMAT